VQVLYVAFASGQNVLSREHKSPRCPSSFPDAQRRVSSVHRTTTRTQFRAGGHWSAEKSSDASLILGTTQITTPVTQLPPPRRGMRSGGVPTEVGHPLFSDASIPSRKTSGRANWRAGASAEGAAASATQGIWHWSDYLPLRASDDEADADCKPLGSDLVICFPLVVKTNNKV
jgi:hypothetical protein